jgi:hypothetical protein
MEPRGCNRWQISANQLRKRPNQAKTVATGAVSLGLLLCMESDSCDARRRRLAPTSASPNRAETKLAPMRAWPDSLTT